ncbi:MAG: ABC transporter ATP-binding protein [Planctomycetota bacterium]
MQDAKPSPITPATPAGSADDAALTVRGVTFGYGPPRNHPRKKSNGPSDAKALDDVSAALRPGRVTVVLGPNASGKSTLLRVMLGQLEPWAGTVTLGGAGGPAVASLAGKPLARRVSYVPQRGGVSFAFSVRQIVAMGRFAFGDERFVDDALEKCGITDLAGRAFNELSGGQQQRVLIARAWAQSRGVGDTPEKNVEPAMRTLPGVVLADEPASSLDLRHAHAAMALFREMADEGLAVLVVLHGLELATRWADEVWLMDRGRIVAAGGADAVLRPEVLSPVYGLGLDRLEHDGQTVLVAKNPPTRPGGDTLS